MLHAANHSEKEEQQMGSAARFATRATVVACAAAMLATGCGPRSAGPSSERANPQTTKTETAASTGKLSAPAALAVQYALAARSWTPQTYRSQYETQLRLAVGRLRSELERVAPTAAQIAGLRRDRARATATVANVRTLLESDLGAEYSIVLEERNVAAGQSVSGQTTNLVALARRGGQWRVVGFTIQP